MRRCAPHISEARTNRSEVLARRCAARFTKLQITNEFVPTPCNAQTFFQGEEKKEEEKTKQSIYLGVTVPKIIGGRGQPSRVLEE
jgi:hypothetical protein